MPLILSWSGCVLYDLVVGRDFASVLSFSCLVDLAGSFIALSYLELSWVDAFNLIVTAGNSNRNFEPLNFFQLLYTLHMFWCCIVNIIILQLVWIFWLCFCDSDAGSSLQVAFYIFITNTSISNSNIILHYGIIIRKRKMRMITRKAKKKKILQNLTKNFPHKKKKKKSHLKSFPKIFLKENLW